jgi:hypothetical protein
MLLVSAEKNELTIIHGVGISDVNELSALGKMDLVK